MTRARAAGTVQELTADEQCGVAEGLTEEELALFDILTKPEPKVTKAEAVCRAHRRPL